MKMFINIIVGICIAAFSLFSNLVNADNVDDYLLKKMADKKSAGKKI